MMHIIDFAQLKDPELRNLPPPVSWRGDPQATDPERLFDHQGQLSCRRGLRHGTVARELYRREVCHL